MLRLLCFSARNCGRLCSSARSRFIEGNPPRTQEPPLPLPGMPPVITIIPESATRLWQARHAFLASHRREFPERTSPRLSRTLQPDNDLSYFVPDQVIDIV